MRKKDAPIDFVILWVDGSDPEWIARKNDYLRLAGREPHTIDVGENRYRDWDNLRYWFRAVEAYAPWVNRIHFVTCGQEPDWLCGNHPKLNFVRHEDFIPKQYLPTFSANPIELNLHRIPGLAEQFVYFNDDFFLTAPVKSTDFFVDGLPCDCISEEPFEYPEPDLFNSILINDIAFLNRHFDRRQVRKKHPEKWYSYHCPHESAKNLLMGLLRNRYFFGFAYSHLPQPFLKSALEEVWSLEPEMLEETCAHKFRDQRDVNQYVFTYYQLLTGRFFPCSRRKTGRVFSAAWDLKEAEKAITTGQYRMICLNDSIADFEQAKRVVNHAFAQRLPEKSSFEC